jgi:hypothetical protein
MAQGFVGTAAASFDASNVKGMYSGTSAALGDYRAGRSDIVDVHGRGFDKTDDSDDGSDDGSDGGPKVH